MTKSKAIIKAIVEADDPPTIIQFDGTKEWHDANGKMHRTGGPAIIRPSGNRLWFKHGKMHRDDGPAMEWASGTRQWWVNGKAHRVGGPSAELADGGKHWWLHGKRHRVGGPAVELADGGKEWWLHGRQFTEDEFYRYIDQDTGEVFLPPGKKLKHD
jgi:hypothetical protein